MKAAGLFAVFLLGKLFVLWGRGLPLSPWMPIAYVWQDLALALAFAAFDKLSRRAALNWTIYTLLVTYAALNVPIARAIASPLTWPMLRAVSGTLADSILRYVTWHNLAAM